MFWNRKKEAPKQDEWVDRHKAKAKEYADTHRSGTPVVAESKDGTWKHGKIIGEHDWALFTFYFTVKFEDGEILKVEERKVTKL